MVIKRIIGAALRAILMAVLVAVPSLVLPSTTVDTAQMVALVAMVAAVATYAEYYSEYPTFLEFRDAPPFNRLRFLALFFCVVYSSQMVAAMDAPDTFLMRISASAASWLDVPFSPVRLMTIAFAEGDTIYDPEFITLLSSLLLAITLLFLGLFWFHARFVFWPIRKKAFNFWINLPLFDPTTGGDVVYRLKRDANFNLSLGFLLPFIIPALLRIWMSVINPYLFVMPELMIWMMCAWAFLPLTLMMRGIALYRVAGLIEAKRRRAYAQTDELQIV